MPSSNKTFALNEGTPPFYYLFDSNVPCVSFSNPSGTTASRSISTTISYSNTACYQTAVVTLTAIDSTGCSQTITATLEDPCALLTLTDIAYSAPFTFSVVGNAQTNLTFSWVYDNQLFTKVSESSGSFDSTLKLTLKTNLSSLPPNSNVQVTATDANGCSETKSYLVTFCVPQAIDQVIDLYLVDGVYSSTFKSIDEPTGCIGSTPDWSTISTTLPSDFSIISSNNTFKFTAPASKAAGTYTGQYSVRDNFGVRSTVATIQFILHPENTTKTIFIPDEVFILDCSVAALDTLSINIEDKLVVSNGATVDWSSFALLSPPNSLSASIQLTTDTNGDHVIEYEVPNPIANDIFAWTICDTNGICSEATVYTITECTDSPTANNDAVTAACDGSTIFDILSNDTGGSSAVDITSVQITQAPTKGTLTKLSDGTVQYTPFNRTATTDTFKYKFKNLFGDESTEATVTITIICAGIDTTINVCAS